jgi:hypothetical protein
MGLELTYNDHGAILSDADGYVTHQLRRLPVIGGAPLWTLYAVPQAYVQVFVGEFATVEAAKVAAEKGGSQ